MNSILRRRRAIIGAKNGDSPIPIPAEYQEVEWIGTSGSYIETSKYLPKEALTITGCAEFTPNSADKYFLSDRDTGGVRFAMFTSATNRFAAISNIVAKSDVFSAEQQTVDFTVNISNPAQSGTETVSGTIAIRGTANGVPFSNSNSGQIRAFGNNAIKFFTASGSDNYVGKLKGRLKVYTDMLYYDFVPCYRIADGKIGIYETVTGAFSTSNGTFTKGADVT